MTPLSVPQFSSGDAGNRKKAEVKLTSAEEMFRGRGGNESHGSETQVSRKLLPNHETNHLPTIVGGGGLVVK